ncbi:hypothetical protein AB6D24_24460, partial [Vibrio splendidus]
WHSAKCRLAEREWIPYIIIAFRMTDTALVGGICVDIRKSMSRFVDAYTTGKVKQKKATFQE